MGDAMSRVGPSERQRVFEALQAAGRLAKAVLEHPGEETRLAFLAVRLQRALELIGEHDNG